MLHEILQNYSSVSLEQMGKVKLLNRVDTKFVTTLHGLEQLLQMAAGSYFIQEIEGKKVMPYTTTYFDTPDFDMYSRHQRGCKTRQKIRVRRYENSGVFFLEVKRKNNHGRTDKKRIEIAERTPDLTTSYRDFLLQRSVYGEATLRPVLSNDFQRITLVNNAMTERLTIDLDLKFHNELNGNDFDMGPIVVVEVKRNGLTHSPVVDILKELRIKQSGFSKYCIGMSLTTPDLKQNRFKERLGTLRRMMAAAGQYNSAS